MKGRIIFCRPLSHPRHRFVRNGFTLLELLLTLAVLTTIAALTLPSLAGLLSGRRLERAADMIRIEVTRSRVDAMRQGKVLMMEVQPETGVFRIKPYVSLTDATESGEASAGVSALATGADQALVVPMDVEVVEPKELELPEDVVFGEVAVASAARSVEIEQNVAANQQGEGFAKPILFYPDGKTSTAAVQLSHPEFGQVTVKIRGMTGEVSIGETTAVQQ